MRPQLLHNMSSRPGTRINAFLRPPGGKLAVFSAEPADRKLLLSKAGREQVEAAWREIGLRGAAAVFDFPSSSSATVSAFAADRLLSLNVLGRTRGSLLLPGTPLAREAALLGRTLVSDDPRLVALVTGTATTSGGAR